MPGDNMQAVRVKLFQQLASYRMPGSYVIRQSYPLPPYSSVIGMVHAACGFTEYVPMSVSIQGDSASSVNEPYTHYSFNNGMNYESARHNVKFKSELKEGSYIGMTRGLQHIELRTDIYLLLHIVPDEPSMFSIIAEGLKNPKQYLSLGRHEDIVRVDEVKIVELGYCDRDDGVTLPCSAYVPIDITELGGTIFRLGKQFETPNKKNGQKVRRWVKSVKAAYACKGMTKEGIVLPVDIDRGVEYPIFLA